MIPLGLDEICQAVGGRWRSVRSDAACPPKNLLAFTSVTTDTRTAKAGDLFFAIRGQNFDGHSFLLQAAAAGCAAGVVNKGVALPDGAAGMFTGGIIEVDDTIAALGALAHWCRKKGDAKVVAVTGSNGKTTVKLMIHHILSRHFRGSVGPKSFNNAIGVPLTLLGSSEGDDYVVCEVGTNAPGEIAALCRIAEPDVAVITSVAKTHLEKLGSIEGVAAEKASMLKYLRGDGPAIVWGDSDVLEKALAPYNVKLIYFGATDGCHLRLTGYQSTGRTQRFEVNGRLWIGLPMSGRHNAINALAAMAAAVQFDLTVQQAGEAIADFSGASMRLEWIDAGEATIINDAYNANPASVVAAADVLAETSGKRRVMIVGDMRELGPAAEILHAQTGSEIASRAVDLLIGVGPLGRYIALGAAEAGLTACDFESVEAATGGLPSLLKRGDTVLIKGSRAMGMERLIEPIRAAFVKSR